MRYWSLHLAFVLCVLSAHAQVINGDAEVTGISGAVLTIGATNEAASTFTVGKGLVLMQMQDNVIGSDTTDASTFGNLSAIKNAGHYEVRTVTAVSRSGGVLLTITLNAAPTSSFTTGANASVQAITYELLGEGGNYTTTANITAAAWNGSTGGVVAFQVNGTLTLQHNITANGAGFRGGARDPYSYDVCYPTTYRASSTDANTWRYASKGEGIYKLANPAWADARGKILNAGGGGNGINAGGGGGGNQSEGGAGGAGWSCSGSPSGGLGGIALSTQIAADRVFMGGGGGGGEGNDNVSTDGGAGGGIILIKAQRITTTGTCCLTISANGSTAAPSGNDGAGGGGAGGSVVVNVPAFTIASGCPLTVSANGGNGGSVNTGDVHGGGGAGGQGTVIFTATLPVTNITVQTANGGTGCNNSSSPCTNAAGSATGASGDGIRSGFTTVLPIELVSFTAVPMQRTVDVSWITASESNNALFSVERSVDAANWQMIGTLPGAINSSSTLSYDLVDDAPLAGTSYYHLVQTDLDGTETRSSIAVVERVGEGSTLFLFPNPATDRATVVFSAGNGTVALLNDLGQEMSAPVLGVNGRAELDLSGLPNGAYTVLLRTERTVLTQRLLVRR